MALPEGFTLEQPAPTAGTFNLPAGFKLETPAASSGIPKGRQSATLTEQALATPGARMLLGAASPLVGALQFGANVGDYINEKTGQTPVVSKAISDWWNEVQAMKERGMQASEPEAVLGGKPRDYMGFAGGFLPGLLQPSTAITKGQQIVEGIKQGTIFGAMQPGTNRLSDQALGAGGGAILGGAAPVVVPALAKGLGWVVDTVTGQLTKVKAADLTRQAAGDQINTIRAALSGAPADMSPAQATSGIQKNTWQSLLQLGAGTDANSLRLKNQYLDQLNALARMAEGGNATEVRAAQERSKSLLNEITDRMRSTELGAANQANKTINELAPKLEQRQKSMVNALRQGMPENLPSGAAGTPAPGVSGIHPETEALQRANVADDAARRLMVARSQAARGGVSESTVPGANDRRIESANRFVSDQWQEAADTFGQIASQRRNEAGFIERQIGSLADHGLKPLDTTGITLALDSTINSPGTRASPILTKTLQAVKDDIAALAEKNGGVIDAHDLYTLRKEGINERIAQLLGPTDPKTSSKLTAKVLSQVKPLIDSAIENAGGTGWSKYLNTYSQGMQGIDQKAMAAEAMRLFKDSPDQYVKLVRGNNPEAVEAIFGKGSYDIFKEMGNKMPTLSKIATELEQKDAISAAAKAGVPELANIVDNQGVRLRVPFMGKASSIANLAISDLEGRVSASTMAKLRAGTATNQSTLDLLNTLPTAEKNAVLKAIIKMRTSGVTAGIVGGNALAPKRENKNALPARLEASGMTTDNPTGQFTQ
jgi:hypothetical protein